MTGRSNKDVHDPRNDVRSQKDDPWGDPKTREEYWLGPHIDPYEYEFHGWRIHITNGNYFLKLDGEWTSDHTDPNIATFDDTPEGKEKARDRLEWENDMQPGFSKRYGPELTRHDYSKKGRGE